LAAARWEVQAQLGRRRVRCHVCLSLGIFPNDASAIRLAGALLIEQTDEWLICRRYLSEESMRLVLSSPRRTKRTLYLKTQKRRTPSSQPNAAPPTNELHHNTRLDFRV